MTNCIRLLLFLVLTISCRALHAEFMEAYPHLQKHVYNEPQSPYYLGFGISPVSLMKDRYYFGASFFQIHRISPRWDLELFSVSYGSAQSQLGQAQSNHFTMRMAPKFRIFPFMSAGLMAGLELVSFPQTNVILLKQPFNTEEQPFSSQGFVYGLMFSETFDYGESYKVKINQSFYKQTYSVEKTPEGWEYYFVDKSVRDNMDTVEPSQVFMLEFSLLY